MHDRTCSIEGCGRTVQYPGKGWCAFHYKRWHRANQVKEACSIDDCDKPQQARGWCAAHWSRWRKYGDPLTLIKGTRVCSVVDCGRPHHGRGLCKSHYYRWSEHGDAADLTAPIRDIFGIVCYVQAHTRVKALHGSASDHPCQHCGKQAKDWAYDHSDPDELQSEKGHAYSLDTAHYIPLCRRCHAIFDRGHLVSPSAGSVH